VVWRCLGFGLSAFFFFGLALVENGIEAVVFLTIAVGLGGIAIAGTSFPFRFILVLIPLFFILPQMM